MVASFPPSPLDGWANSMGLPLRNNPRDSSRLLMYVDAVLRLYDSMAAFGCRRQAWAWAWAWTRRCGGLLSSNVCLPCVLGSRRSNGATAPGPCFTRDPGSRPAAPACKRRRCYSYSMSVYSARQPILHNNAIVSRRFSSATSEPACCTQVTPLIISNNQ